MNIKNIYIDILKIAKKYKNVLTILISSGIFIINAETAYVRTVKKK